MKNNFTECIDDSSLHLQASGGDAANAVDADAAALEEEAREEFLLLDDLVKEVSYSQPLAV